MNKQQQIKEIAEILKNSATESTKYFQAEVKKAFRNGAKNLKRNDCEKSIHDIAAEDLYNAGYRKVPYGAVVLTPEERDEEMEATNEILAERDKLKAKIDKLEEQLAEYKKPIDKFINDREVQSVREFAERLKKTVTKYLYRTNFDGHKDFDIDFAELCRIIDELLKEYE